MEAGLSQSQEDYLESILELSADQGVARVRDIASRMGVSMPSVNGALKRLEKQGFINHSRYEFITLTTKGKRRAVKVAGKHSILNRFFADFLRISPAQAELDACSVEHHLSEDSTQALKKLFDFIDSPEGTRWLFELHSAVFGRGDFDSGIGRGDSNQGQVIAAEKSPRSQTEAFDEI